MIRTARVLAFAATPISIVDLPLTAEPVVLPPYVLLLHNDEVNTMDHVVRTLLASVPELDEEEAITIMLRAHTERRAVVIQCPLERAELYRNRLEQRGLTATIEQG